MRLYRQPGTSAARCDLSAQNTDAREAVELAVNTRPRKTLGWRTPAEAFDEHLRLVQTTIATTGRTRAVHVASFTEVLTHSEVQISMGRWIDNVFLERLWRSPKYECVDLRAVEPGSELRTRLTRWIGFTTSARRPHSALRGLTPDEAYATIGAGRNEGERLAA